MERSQASPFRVRIARGPRRAEDLLLEEVASATAELGAGILRKPVLVVVPSHSLRLHTLGRLTRASGGAIAGVDCTTLRGLALRLARAAPGPPPATADLLPLYSRRFAAAEPSLVRSLEHLRDGFSAVLGTVRDLLEAGLDPAHEEALDEALAAEGPEVASESELARGRGLIVVAARVSAELRDKRLYHRSALLQCATELLAEGGVPVPGHVVVHGFADATGTATDLLLEALRQWGGTFILDRPPDPARPDLDDPGSVHGRRFVERVLAAGGPAEEDGGDTPLASVQLVRSMGATAEVREVAYRIRTLLDEGVRAEGIAVVARDFRHYRSPLRLHFGRLGLPFSGMDVAGPAGPVSRRIRAVLDLLSLERATPVERWLDARGRGFRGAAPFDLRLALFALGAGRLHEVAELDLDPVLDGDSFPLPVRHGFFQMEDDEEDENDDLRNEIHLRRRRIPAAVLREAVEAARSLCRRFEARRPGSNLGERLASVRSLLFKELGWRPDEDAGAEVLSRLDRSLRGVPDDLEVDREELTTLLREILEGAGRVELGGRGGGVQVLDVIEARGRTFEALFVLGMNRGVFPRTVREDPILPDALRSVLAREGHGVLPDLPTKRAGFDEERYLFAQLVSAAPRVTLSWQDADEDNSVLTPSPLIERLRWTDGGIAGRLSAEPATARDLYSGRDTGLDEVSSPPLQPAFEHSVMASLRGDRERLRRLLPLALWEAHSDPTGRLEPAAYGGLASARLRVLAEMDPVRGTGAGEATRSRLGPYFGWVGEPAEELDPRRADSLYVTTLERLCGCPWQVFLERILRIQPLPDPLEVLPGIDALVVGDLIHVVAERIVTEAHPQPAESLEEARSRDPQTVPWPADEKVESILAEEAVRVARRHGIGLPGFDRVLARRVLPYLAEIRRLDWQAGPLSNLSAEARGSLRLSDATGVERSISFKVDRLDAGTEGLVFSDYKSGRRPVSGAKTEKTRRAHFLRDVRSGSRLQAAAYVVAGGGESDRGRYVFVNPDLDAPDEARDVGVSGGDAELLDAFEEAARTALASWSRGAFFPRLVRPDRDEEPVRCRFCTVAEACLRGDSGARLRLGDWVEGRATDRDGVTPAEGSLLRTWFLGRESRR